MSPDLAQPASPAENRLPQKTIADQDIDDPGKVLHAETGYSRGLFLPAPPLHQGMIRMGITGVQLLQHGRIVSEQIQNIRSAVAADIFYRIFDGFTEVVDKQFCVIN